MHHSTLVPGALIMLMIIGRTALKLDEALLVLVTSLPQVYLIPAATASNVLVMLLEVLLLLS